MLCSYGQISSEYQFGQGTFGPKKTNLPHFVVFFPIEKPAIDRLLDYISNQESRKPAIDILIQEYLERIGSPLTYQLSHISPLMEISK